MAIDLHLHSTISDGESTPTEIVERAVAARLTAMALTDHDTFEGIAEARSAAAGKIAFVPGVEMSVSWDDDRSFHMLAYWVDGESDLDEALDPVRHGRAIRNRAIVADLQGLGYPVTEDALARISPVGVAGRPHIAAALMELGVVADTKEAFERFLGRGCPAYRERPRLSVERTVDLVTRAGGVTVVAHPTTVADNAADYDRMFGEFATAGIVGVECWYGAYDPDVRNNLAALAGRYGLVATGGSDYHGPMRKPGLEVGIGYGDLAVPDQVVEHLAARRP